MDRTLAEEVCDLLGDGQTWETGDGSSLDSLCEQRAAIHEKGRLIHDHDGQHEFDEEQYEQTHGDIYDLRRWAFPDGSAIVISGGAWDIEGRRPWSWQGA